MAALNEFWRQCRDDELATWFRDPAQWSYVVRAPNGQVVSHGKSNTRDECEERAIRHAEEYVEDNAMIFMSEGVNMPSFATYEEAVASDFELDHRWDWSLLGEWQPLEHLSVPNFLRQRADPHGARQRVLESSARQMRQ